MNTVDINRAPVLTLWAVIVAERVGFKRNEALTIGKAVAGQTAHRKGTRIGIYEPTAKAIKEARAAKREEAGVSYLSFMGREIPILNTDDGLRAVNKDARIKPESVEKYFESKFGETLDEVTEAMQSLAKSRPPKQLASDAFKMYIQFRPEVAAGKTGWGAKGVLSLSLIREMANFPK
ncbi:MAG: hypothetical protein AB8C46_04905 [Burkholderiaceae bacterium]